MPDDDPICHRCAKPAENDLGTIYVRCQGPDGRWRNAAICTPCWRIDHAGRVPVRVMPRSQWPAPWSPSDDET